MGKVKNHYWDKIEGLWVDECPEKLEPKTPTQTLADQMVEIGNIRMVVTLASGNMDAVKSQVGGAFTALTHCHNDLDTRSLTAEHLEFALRELKAIPFNRLLMDIEELKEALKGGE